MVQLEIAASRALYAGSLGFAIGAFFLSQSYKYMLFLMCGLAVGRFIGANGRGWRTLVIQDQGGAHQVAGAGLRQHRRALAWPQDTSVRGTVYPELFRHVLFPAYETLTRRGYAPVSSRNIAGTQWLDAETIAHIQLDKLNALIGYCWQQVPYLEKRWRGAGFDAAPTPVGARAGILSNSDKK